MPIRPENRARYPANWSMNRALVIGLGRLAAYLLTLAVFAIALGWIGPSLDAAPIAYPAHVANALLDAQACQQLHGPHAWAEQLPDGQHRCTDDAGRALRTHEGRP